MAIVRRHPWDLNNLMPTPLGSLPSGNDLHGLVELQQSSAEQGYPLGVMTADGSSDDSSRTLHIEGPWSEALLDRPDAGPRSLAYAQALGARAYVIDTPGFGVDAAPLPREVLSGLWQGDLHPAARLQWDAYSQVLGGIAVDERYGLGSSEGAIMLAASMATAPEGTHYNGVILNESPGLKRQFPWQVMTNFAIDTVLQPKITAAYRSETPGEGEYVPGNPMHMRKLARAVINHPAHYLAHVAAMSKDHLEDDIETAYERDVINSETQLVFVTGTRGRVSPVEWNTVRAQNIRRRFGLGGVHLVTLLGENHAMYESTGRMHSVLKRIGEELFELPALNDAA